MEGVDRRSRQALVRAEEPHQDLFIAESAVMEYRQETRQPLDDLTVVPEELFGDTEHTVAAHGDHLMVAERLMDMGHDQPEALRNVRQLQQRDGTVQDVVTVRDGTHSPNVIGSLLARRYRSVALATMD